MVDVLPHFELQKAGEDDSALRILQLTDMHLFPNGATAWMCSAKGVFAPRRVDFSAEGFPSPLTPVPAATMVAALLRRARPHLIIFTGDIVDGRPFGSGHPALNGERPLNEPEGEQAFGAFADAFMRVLAPLLECGVPWCFCPGNHDDDGSPWTRQDLLRIFALPGCATPTATRFDHTLTVGFSARADERSVRLWIFDSGPNRKDIKYEPVAADAVHAYESLSQTLPAVGAELAYVHVPLPEYATARIVAGTCGLFEARVLAGMMPQPWQRMPRWLARRLGPLFGQDRAVGCSRINTGLCTALAERRTVRALSCGHNHFNDFVALHGEGGPFLCFGRVSGLSPPVTWEHDGGHLPFEPGGRVLAVRTADGQPAHVETWVQMAEASEDHIVLDPHEASVYTAVESGKVIERWRSVLLVFGVVAVLLRTTSRG